jgi:hypothetical protein
VLKLPTDVVFLIVLWRLRMKLSLQDLAEILLLRGLVLLTGWRRILIRMAGLK